MTPFNPESLFSLRALSSSDSPSLVAAGIPVMSTLSDYTERIQNILGITMAPNLDLNALLSNWISSDIKQVPPTWKNLFQIIHLLNLDDLAQMMEAYLTVTVEPGDYSVGEITIWKVEGEGSSI